MTKKKPPARPLLPVKPNKQTGHVHMFLNMGGTWECDCGEKQ